LADAEAQKAAAAARALDFVEPNMLLGLGSGSTVRYFIEGLGERVRQGLAIRAVPTSEQSAELARSLTIPLVRDLPDLIDLAVDGADEVDPDLGLIKGRGGALVREKLVASAARRFVVIVDDSKLVPRLGRGPLPVEIVPFLWQHTRARLQQAGATITVRGGEREPLRSDNGNMILDLTFDGGIGDPSELARTLKATVGVVDHGLFLGMTDAVIVAGSEGIRIVERC
jgi:ribose 5-phosphate isomerase A